MTEPSGAAVDAAQSYVRGILYNAGKPLDERGTAVNIARAVLAAAHLVPAPDIADRTNLARALGLAQAIARAKPYPVEMDGVRAVAGEIVTLLEGITAVAHPVPEDAERFRKGLKDALGVSFTVGLLRTRAEKEGDAELAEWGEKLKAQLVAIREVLSPGTAEALAALRQGVAT